MIRLQELKLKYLELFTLTIPIALRFQLSIE